MHPYCAPLFLWVPPHSHCVSARLLLLITIQVPAGPLFTRYLGPLWCCLVTWVPRFGGIGHRLAAGGWNSQGKEVLEPDLQGGLDLPLAGGPNSAGC